MTGARSLCAMRGCPQSIGAGEHLCKDHLAQLGGVLAYAWKGYASPDPVRVLPDYPVARPVAHFTDALWIALARMRPRDPEREWVKAFITACHLAQKLPDAIGESWLQWLRLQPRRLDTLGPCMLILSYRDEVRQ